MPARRGDTVADLVTVQPYVQMQTLFDEAWPPGRRYYNKSSVMRRVTTAAAGALVARAQAMPTPLSAIALQQAHGAATRVPADATAETRECTDAWTAGHDRLERLAVLYAIESAQPAISQTKLDGLVTHYGFDEGPATEYFTVHADRDHEHAARSRELLEKLATEEDAPRLSARAEAAALPPRQSLPRIHQTRQPHRDQQTERFASRPAAFSSHR